MGLSSPAASIATACARGYPRRGLAAAGRSMRTCAIAWKAAWGRLCAALAWSQRGVG